MSNQQMSNQQIIYDKYSQNLHKEP